MGTTQPSAPSGRCIKACKIARNAIIPLNAVDMHNNDVDQGLRNRNWRSGRVSGDPSVERGRDPDNSIPDFGDEESGTDASKDDGLRATLWSRDRGVAAVVMSDRRSRFVVVVNVGVVFVAASVDITDSGVS